jgi:outer membrane protein OmpA-like peptidoglycan-associated protein
MRVQPFAAALVLALAAGAAVAQQTETAGRQLDLIFSIQDLQARTDDLRFVIDDLGGKPTNVAGAAQNLEVKETKTEIRIELAADVLFDFDKSNIRSSAQDALKQAAAIIRPNASRVTRIEGHTDAKGNDAYNQRLSEARATSVRDWFVAREGLANVRFVVQGFGAKRPVASNTKPDGSDDPAGRQKNRRVEIIIAK